MLQIAVQKKLAIIKLIITTVTDLYHSCLLSILMYSCHTSSSSRAVVGTDSYRDARSKYKSASSQCFILLFTCFACVSSPACSASAFVRKDTVSTIRTRRIQIQLKPTIATIQSHSYSSIGLTITAPKSEIVWHVARAYAISTIACNHYNVVEMSDTIVVIQ